VNSDPAEEEGFLSRFQLEVKAMAALNHAHILKGNAADFLVRARLHT
jgi:hypothetical protein